MEENKLPIFPESIMPDKIIEDQFYTIENDDFINDKEVKNLIELMYKYPERKFYLYAAQGEPLNQYLQNATDKNKILMNICDFHFYRHPKHKRDYVKINKDNITFDWQRKVISKSPMFRRITLNLTEETKKELDIKKSRGKLYFWVAVIIAVLLTIISILLTYK